MDIDPNELPRITSKQEAFVEGLVQGKSASDAYRAAYDCSSMAEPTVWSEASRLRANPKVSAWLRHFQRMGMDEARITIGEHLAELARGREVAYALGQASAGIQAEHYRGKAAGLYEDRLSLAVGPSDAELIKAIEDLLGKETADAISAALGGP
jgi:phage terminase small subunit